jgi:diaminopimelate epimerase
MRYYNSDGNESTMCGNGGRCICAFADFLSLPGPEYLFYAIDGEHKGTILRKNDSFLDIRLKMNDVKTIGKWGQDDILDTGSPHLVRFVQDTDNLDVIKEGRLVRYHPDFLKDGINANFVRIDGDQLFVRTYERGVEDETLSCGTGVTASVLAFALRTGKKEGSCRVVTRGGTLKVAFARKDNEFTDIWLEGPATRVFEGFIEI